ncbi:MAG: hypothetical protein ACRELV_06710 [Longimicrobiales bacterium]
MSSGGSAGLPEWDRLELAARRLLTGYGTSRDRARAAEARVRELERAVRDLSKGGADPVQLHRDIERLEKENRELHGRIALADERLQRILARLRFLQDES